MPKSRWEILGPTLVKVLSGRKRKFVRCRCKCGTVRYVQEASIKSNRSKSCGCVAKENSTPRPVRHGYSRRNRAPEYKVWSAMLSRCRNQNDANWPRYGGAGITVCKRWYRFENFIRDMGKRPAGKRLGRKNVTNGYTKKNTLWVTMEESANNRRKSCLITYQGVRMTAARWGRKFGIPSSTITNRILRGKRGKMVLFG
jgi:hypothetical protein